MRRIGIVCILMLMALPVARAQVSLGENATLSGRVYSDYYWVVSNHNEALEGSNGFWFRRIYLTYDQRLSDAFSSRLRLEMDSEGDFFSDSKMSPVVKDAYLKWENDQHEVVAGISSTPTFGLIEDVWGYRAVEKTPLDLQDMASSRDFGLAAKGTLGGDERLNYHAMIGNGHGNVAEINQGKKLMLSLAYELTDNLVIEGYADWNDLPGETDWTTIQGFIGYQKDNIGLGAMYARQYREYVLPFGSVDQTLDIASVFARGELSATTSGFIRVDHLFDANPDGEGIDYIPFSEEAESTFLLGGIDFTLEENIHLIPNVEAVVYGESAQGVSPDTDLITRLTLYYRF